MRPGFLAGTTYWFGDLPDYNNNELYRPETKIPWYKEFWVEKPFWEKYWKN